MTMQARSYPGDMMKLFGTPCVRWGGAAGQRLSDVFVLGNRREPTQAFDNARQDDLLDLADFLDQQASSKNPSQRQQRRVAKSIREDVAMIRRSKLVHHQKSHRGRPDERCWNPKWSCDMPYPEYIGQAQIASESALPSFKEMPVRDAKVVRQPAGRLSEDQRELRASLPDGVSVKASGYADRY